MACIYVLQNKINNKYYSGENNVAKRKDIRKERRG